MEVHAKLKHLRMSPRKVRLVADVIRGLDVKDAINQLSFINKRAAGPLLKLLNSAIANAENNFKFKRDNLYIKELRVDQGPTLKRWKPRAFGRATPINKRTSHINIILDEKVKSEPKTQITERRDKKPADSAGKKKKDDKDVKVVQSLDEIKELDKPTDSAGKDKKPKDDKRPVTEEHAPKIKDPRREGSGRSKQHLDTIRKKDVGGRLKRMFRRKSV